MPWLWYPIKQKIIFWFRFICLIYRLTSHLTYQSIKYNTRNTHFLCFSLLREVVLLLESAEKEPFTTSGVLLATCSDSQLLPSSIKVFYSKYIYNYISIIHFYIRLCLAIRRYISVKNFAKWSSFIIRVRSVTIFYGKSFLRPMHTRHAVTYVEDIRCK